MRSESMSNITPYVLNATTILMTVPTPISSHSSRRPRTLIAGSLWSCSKGEGLTGARRYPVEREVLALHDLPKAFSPRPRVVVALGARDDYASTMARAV